MYVKYFPVKVEQGFYKHEIPSLKRPWEYYVTVFHKAKIHTAVEAFAKRQKKTTPIYARLEAQARKSALHSPKAKILRRGNNNAT